MNLVTFGVGLGMVFYAHNSFELFGGLFVMGLAAAIEAAERYGDARRSALAPIPSETGDEGG